MRIASIFIQYFLWHSRYIPNFSIASFFSQFHNMLTLKLFLSTSNIDITSQILCTESCTCMIITLQAVEIALNASFSIGMLSPLLMIHSWTAFTIDGMTFPKTLFASNLQIWLLLRTQILLFRQILSCNLKDFLYSYKYPKLFPLVFLYHSPQSYPYLLYTLS